MGSDFVEIMTFTRESDCAAIESALIPHKIPFFISGRGNYANDGLPKRLMVEAGRAQEARELLKGVTSG